MSSADRREVCCCSFSYDSIVTFSFHDRSAALKVHKLSKIARGELAASKYLNLSNFRFQYRFKNAFTSRSTSLCPLLYFNFEPLTSCALRHLHSHCVIETLITGAVRTDYYFFYGLAQKAGCDWKITMRSPDSLNKGSHLSLPLFTLPMICIFFRSQRTTVRAREELPLQGSICGRPPPLRSFCTFQRLFKKFPILGLVTHLLRF